MIRFEGVTKRFPGADRPAVDALDLVVAEATTCALIGPSGCGKSTTLRMVNRLIEPDTGRIRIGERDIASVDPVTLRRGIGYVLQGVGLFPHRSVAQNVATVPALLGWPRARIAARVEAMLDLVGLEPDRFGDRRPDALSGGQRQRVGVARALAADPDVILMDEPFGAVDPVARDRLQSEIGAILKRLRKTVILVTHDIGEAMRMGDQIALMRDGRLVQAGSPDHLLAAPADAFTAHFLGETRALRRLERLQARDFAQAPAAGEAAPAIPEEASLQEALDRMLETGTDRVTVGDRSLTLEAVRAAARAAPGEGGD
ncbi:glycine/betaine ABC transporter [Methylorubrum populi]|uniref:Glycine/betaine ABC transporter n=1 Tax=Methylobacterium radiotolerans TaxID=31998 RepID=A0ABU7TCE8_9HYPH|nr:ABC transporter ATP-binding protein [Methylobacterium sp. B4]PXW63867.1 osmoprotectant transport system ATP-binding protein [Methylobacterium sp. B4]